MKITLFCNTDFLWLIWTNVVEICLLSDTKKIKKLVKITRGTQNKSYIINEKKEAAIYSCRWVKGIEPLFLKPQFNTLPLS